MTAPARLTDTLQALTTLWDAHASIRPVLLRAAGILKTEAEDNGKWKEARSLAEWAEERER